MSEVMKRTTSCRTSCWRTDARKSSIPRRRRSSLKSSKLGDRHERHDPGSRGAMVQAGHRGIAGRIVGRVRRRDGAMSDGKSRAARWLAERAADHRQGRQGASQRQHGLDAFAGCHARRQPGTPKRTACPRRSPMARRGVSMGALPAPSDASQVRCARSMHHAGIG